MTKNTKAPNFKLESTSGKIIELNKIKSKYIVLYFYPKDDTQDVLWRQKTLINFLINLGV